MSNDNNFIPVLPDDDNSTVTISLNAYKNLLCKSRDFDTIAKAASVLDENSLCAVVDLVLGKNIQLNKVMLLSTAEYTQLDAKARELDHEYWNASSDKTSGFSDRTQDKIISFYQRMGYDGCAEYNGEIRGSDNAE